MTILKENWSITDSSAADTAKTISEVAPGEGRQLVCTWWHAVVRGAVTDTDVSVLLQDADGNNLDQDYFGSAAARGARIGLVYGERTGLPVPINIGFKIVSVAGGSGCIITMSAGGIVQ